MVFGEAQNSPVLSSPENQPFANESVISPAKKYLVWYFPAGKFPGSIKAGGRHCGAQPGIPFAGRRIRDSTGRDSEEDKEACREDADETMVQE